MDETMPSDLASPDPVCMFDLTMICASAPMKPPSFMYSSATIMPVQNWSVVCVPPSSKSSPG
jgi:hypothetical protein